MKVRGIEVVVALVSLAGILAPRSSEARNPHCAGGIQYVVGGLRDKGNGNLEDYQRQMQKAIQQLESCAVEDTIDYEATIDDAKVFTRPWTIRVPLRRARPAGGDKYADETWENACHEGNEATEHNRVLGFKWFRGVTPPK